MNIIGIIGLIIQVLRFLPDIISLIKAILDLIRSLKGTPGFDDKAILKNFAEALRYAKETKDTSKLEELHKQLVSACAGGVCPSGV